MNPLQQRLAALRRRFRFTVTFRGVCWLLTILLGTAALAGMLDWGMSLPSLVRAVILAGALAGAGYISYRFLLLPLWSCTDDLALALRVEALYPNLNDSLASTVQFLEEPTDSERAGSASLRRVAVQRTMRRLDDYDFNRAVSTRGLGTAGLSLAAAGALAVTLVLLYPTLAWTALKRLADPFGGTTWPRQTQLEIEVGRTQVARGQPFEIHCRVAGMVPDQATVSFEGMSPSRHAANVNKDKEGKRGSFTVRLDRVERSFRFQVTANDAVSDWLSITVLPPPVLVALDGRASPQVQLRFPAYTDLPLEELPDGSGNIQAVPGTHVALRAATDRPLARAWIEYRPEHPLVKQAAFLGLLGARHPAAALSLTAAGQEVWEDVPVQIEANRQVLSAEFLPRVTGMYALHFEDEAGLRNTRLFDLRIVPDPAPMVTLERPSQSHDSLDVLPGAEITLLVVAEDQQYALRSLYVAYRCKKEDPSRRLPLYDHAALGAALPRMAVSLAGLPPVPCPLPPVAPPLRLRPQHLENSQRLALARFKHLDGSSLKEGDVLTLQACAEDFDDIAVDKQPGRSHEVELRIVGPAALEKALNQAQAQVQQELVRLHKMQQDALKQVIGAEQEWRNTGKLKPQDIDQLLQGEQLQQQIRARVGTRKEGLRAEVERILQTLRDNQLPRSSTHDRMETVADELERLSREELEQVESRLTNARKENETTQEPRTPAKNERGQLGEARRHQEQIENTLNELLKLLEPWSKIKDVKGEAKAILQDQRKLNQETRDLDKENTRGQDRDALTPEQRAALDKGAELQGKMEERTEELLNKMERIGRERQNQDPDTAEALKKAAQQGRDGNLSGQMKNAGQNIRNNQLSKATGEQRQGTQTLEQMVRALEEEREKELDRLSKKLKDAEDKLADLTSRQEELRKKMKEAAQNPDPAERKKELERLAREQDKLQKEAQDMLRELTRLRANRAAKALSDAGNSMDQAARQLEQGQDPEEQQDDALDRLQEAQEKLQREQEDVEEELAREKLARVADQIKQLKERQEAARIESARLQELAAQRKQWTRPLRFSLKQLADAQKGLAVETEDLAKGKLAGAKVFTHIMSKAAESMRQAADQIRDHFDQTGDAPEVTEEDKEIRRLQDQALRRLDHLLDALKPEKGLAQRQGNQGGGDGQQAGGKGAGDSIPPMAQLKALRALQQEVNERTDQFAREHPNLDKLKKEEINQLEAIHKDQKDVATLLDEVTAPVEGPEGESK